MDLQEFVGQVVGFDALTPKDKIKLFGWFLHTHQSLATFDNEAMRNCFKKLHLTPPDVSIYLPRMAQSKPAELLKERGRYKLARATRADFDKKYGLHQSVVQISNLLSGLADTVPDLAERSFLQEAMKCYRVEAFRACVVMTWNLAFDHFLRWILKDANRLSDFNSAITRRFPKKSGIAIAVQHDFEELKEFETIEIAQTAGLFSKNTGDILREKLKRRNMCAHPSGVTISQSQADDTITDLVNNVVLILV